jgi:hypothetical protein
MNMANIPATRLKRIGEVDHLAIGLFWFGNNA